MRQPLRTGVPISYMRYMTSTIEAIEQDFDFLDSWEDRYRYLIELGRDLPEFEDADRTAANRVQGCVSQVWLLTDVRGDTDPVMTFRADSDAHIVKGLVAVLLALFSGRRASEILATDAEELLRRLGLDEHLSSQRANGLRAMVRRIRIEAEAAMAG